jgi:endonuclease YncB( thermonuclease family)
MSFKKTHIVLILIICLVIIGWRFAMAGPKWYPVKWVADGDTIYLEDGRAVRLIGVNAPEVAHNDRPSEPFGETAKQVLTRHLKNRKVRLEWDQERKDHYGRSLAHVFDQQNQLISQIMVQKGLAHVLYHKNNTCYFDDLLKKQQMAMTKKKGFWKIFKNSKQHFVGNKRSLRFHAKTCKDAKKIYYKNKIVFTNTWDAFYQGYTPAKKCLGGIGKFL